MCKETLDLDRCRDGLYARDDLLNLFLEETSNKNWRMIEIKSEFVILIKFILISSSSLSIKKQETII